MFHKIKKINKKHSSIMMLMKLRTMKKISSQLNRLIIRKNLRKKNGLRIMMNIEGKKLHKETTR